MMPVNCVSTLLFLVSANVWQQLPQLQQHQLLCEDRHQDAHSQKKADTS
jgi:hypothetical protein